MSNDLTKIGELVKLELKQSAVVTPKNYSFENALKSAWLILQETTDRQKRPVLEHCTDESIHNAILNMAVQGLNPAKDQCYFVAYGQQLQLIRSYMGSQMTAKLVNPAIADIRAQVIYSGDEVDVDIVAGREIVTRHTRKFGVAGKADIIGAYALAVGTDDKILFSEIMDMDEIKASWKQSKMAAVSESGAINQQSTHGKFTGEMSKRTVINRLCKRIINTSDDSALLAGAVESDEDRPEAEIIAGEIDRNANQKILDFRPRQLEPVQADFEAATDEQCRRIFDRIGGGGKDEMFGILSDFIGREVTGLKQLSSVEAVSFLNRPEPEAEPEPEPQDKLPDWA